MKSKEQGPWELFCWALFLCFLGGRSEWMNPNRERWCMETKPKGGGLLCVFLSGRFESAVRNECLDMF